jgi:hypothetical protein
LRKIGQHGMAGITKESHSSFLVGPVLHLIDYADVS